MQRSQGTFFFVTGLVVFAALIAASLQAQDTSDAKPKSRRSPLPYYYGKLGVDNDQRAKLYSIQDSFEAKLESLREQMKALLAEREAAMEATLSPGQKLRLNELKADAVKNAKAGTQPKKAEQPPKVEE